MDNFSINWYQEALDEYNNLDGSQRTIVDKGLKRIKTLGMQTGEPLHGELEGCRKLKYRRLGIRIVFKQSSEGITIINIVTIGIRKSLNVYTATAVRLGVSERPKRKRKGKS